MLTDIVITTSSITDQIKLALKLHFQFKFYSIIKLSKVFTLHQPPILGNDYPNLHLPNQC